MPRFLRAALVGALVLAAPAAHAQQSARPASPAAAAKGLPVGAVAPDFSLPGATRYGTLATPVRLSDFRGQTVVIAFFYRARTKGWTVQMEAYRDQYATLFNGGRDVVVIGISVDPDTTLASWARDAGFPMLFASDTAGHVGRLYQAHDPKSGLDDRSLYVIGPDGRVAYHVSPFRQLVPAAYEELAAVVDRLSPPPADPDEEP